MQADGDDLAALYLAESDRLQRQISRRIACRATAADLVQDVFLRLWERTVAWNGDGRAFLARCVRNAAIDHVRAEEARRRALAGVLPEQLVAAPASAEEILAARQGLATVETALAALPDRTRHIFLLNRVHGRSFSEIADVMGLSRRTVATHVAAAMRACADARAD